VHDSLRTLFDRALGDEPAPPGALAQQAMASGKRLRRRRRLFAGGGAAAVATVLGTVIAVSSARTPAPEPADAVAMAMRPACTQAMRAFEAALFLRADVTDQERDELYRALRSDARVGQVTYESKQQAYARFKQMYQEAPDLVASVTTGQMPETFRVKLRDPSGYPAFATEAKGRPGVETVVVAQCTEGSSSGAIE
jgi:cell division transport system permease protein